MARVSVVVPTHNRPHLLVRAVRSVLAQTFSDLEVLIADDASTGDVAEAVTRIGDTHVPDDVFDRTRQQFEEAELVALNFAVIAINAWNRIAITFRAPVGTYQPQAAKAVTA